MTKFDAAFLSCRVLAVWVLTQAISRLAALPAAFGILSDPEQSKHFGLFVLSSSILPFLLLAVMGGGLWAGASRLAKRMTDAPSADTTLLTRGMIEQIAFTVIGVFLLVQAIPEAAQQGVTHLLTGPDVQASAYAAFVGKNWELVLRFALGVWLVTGAPHLSRWLHGVRQPVPNHS